MKDLDPGFGYREEDVPFGVAQEQRPDEPPYNGNVSEYQIPRSGEEPQDVYQGVYPAGPEKHGRKRLYTTVAAGVLAVGLVAGGAVKFLTGGEEKVEGKRTSNSAPEKPGPHEADTLTETDLRPVDKYTWALGERHTVKAVIDGEVKTFHTIDELAANFQTPVKADLVKDPDTYVNDLIGDINSYLGIVGSVKDPNNEVYKFYAHYYEDGTIDEHTGPAGALYDYLGPAFEDGLFAEAQNGAEQLPADNIDTFRSVLNTSALDGGLKWKPEHIVSSPSNNGATHVSFIGNVYAGSERTARNIINMEVQRHGDNYKIISIVIEDGQSVGE